MAKVRKDQYSNVAYGSVTCSAANTLTFDAIQMAVGIFQGIAMVIHKVLYYPSAGSLRELVAATDSLQMALTSSNRLTNIYEVSEPAIIDHRMLVGVGAAIATIELPLVTHFDELPGGGKIIAANPLYVGIFTEGAAAASNMRVEINFSFIELADKDYIELIQSQLAANVG